MIGRLSSCPLCLVFSWLLALRVGEWWFQGNHPKIIWQCSEKSQSISNLDNPITKQRETSRMTSCEIALHVFPRLGMRLLKTRWSTKISNGVSKLFILSVFKTKVFLDLENQKKLNFLKLRRNTRAPESEKGSRSDILGIHSTTFFVRGGMP
jgi:hypothetical protein